MVSKENPLEQKEISRMEIQSPHVLLLVVLNIMVDTLISWQMFPKIALVLRSQVARYFPIYVADDCCFYVKQTGKRPKM